MKIFRLLLDGTGSKLFQTKWGGSEDLFCLIISTITSGCRRISLILIGARKFKADLKLSKPYRMKWRSHWVNIFELVIGLSWSYTLRGLKIWKKIEKMSAEISLVLTIFHLQLNFSRKILTAALSTSIFSEKKENAFYFFGRFYSVTGSQTRKTTHKKPTYSRSLT